MLTTDLSFIVSCVLFAVSLLVLMLLLIHMYFTCKVEKQNKTLLEQRKAIILVNEQNEKLLKDIDEKFKVVNSLESKIINLENKTSDLSNNVNTNKANLENKISDLTQQVSISSQKTINIQNLCTVFDKEVQLVLEYINGVQQGIKDNKSKLQKLSQTVEDMYKLKPAADIHGTNIQQITIRRQSI
ncbi:hypothetical protein EDL79_02625 [Ehrlichia ruminantium]|uniref:Uncharacterized protein n=2 Tax=Ehrlichia ruminantium TaxID=779 RepID=A0AAE6Q918_EHRRU|nr:hypothetical protein [Ehrlichia ruminantium]QGR03452.1 hypothetical protein EDL80_02615 [Ehrlichia ruminantium]QGR04377.1 hypothetical protein EDL79_02625 [Ehrlichia ruminantium]